MNKRIKKKKAQQTVWLSPKAHRALKAYCDETGMKMQAAASRLILDALEEP